jgi:hypothetical protein
MPNLLMFERVGARQFKKEAQRGTGRRHDWTNELSSSQWRSSRESRCLKSGT